MANFKVLPLPSFVSFADRHNAIFIGSMEEMGYIPMKPIFNRDGWYYDRKKKYAWYECNGRAWDGSHCTEDFIYEMQQLDVKALTQTERKAIETLIIYKICPKELKDLLRKDTDNKRFHETYWKSYCGAKKRFEDFKKRRNIA